jgi:hypothetical protein
MTKGFLLDYENCAQDVRFILYNTSTIDSLAEWSKAPDLGSGPKGRGFKSHSCQFELFV